TSTFTDVPAGLPRDRSHPMRNATRLFGAALLLAAGVSRADGPTVKAVLSVRLVSLRSNNGRIGCGLYASEKGFPKDRGAAIQTRWCAIANKESLCAFDAIASGTYAVASFHDENNNGTLDTRAFGIPTEGMVASNHAKGFIGAELQRREILVSGRCHRA